VNNKGELQYKSNMHERQANFETQAKADKVKRNPFNAKINEESLANATRVQANKMS